MNQRELVRFARIALSDPDEERQCKRCHHTMHLPPELDPTPFCNPCAQFLLESLAHAFLQQRKNQRG